MRKENRVCIQLKPVFLLVVIVLKYMGSKSRIAKYIVPIIQKYIDDNEVTKYVEPFVGGRI